MQYLSKLAVSLHEFIVPQDVAGHLLAHVQYHVLPETPKFLKMPDQKPLTVASVYLLLQLIAL